jgi:hypothetical protein
VRQKFCVTPNGAAGRIEKRQLSRAGDQQRIIDISGFSIDMRAVGDIVAPGDLGIDGGVAGGCRLPCVGIAGAQIGGDLMAIEL